MILTPLENVQMKKLADFNPKVKIMSIRFTIYLAKFKEGSFDPIIYLKKGACIPQCRFFSLISQLAVVLSIQMYISFQSD